MASNLLLYRFIIFNGLTIAVTSALTWSGCLLPVFEHNQSRSTLVIMAVFLASLLWSWINRSSTSSRPRTRRKYTSIEGGRHPIRKPNDGPPAVAGLSALHTIVAAVLAFLFLAMPAAALEPETIARQVGTSVIRIFVKGPEGTVTGTGFVVADGGWVATNHHVVAKHIESGWPIEVLPSGPGESERLQAELATFWPDEDFALLRVPGLDRRPLTFAANPQIEAGVTVFVLGFPGSADRLGPVGVASFAEGTVSRRFEGHWTAGAGQPFAIIQHTAAINPGNSGGPLLNSCGEVVGINTQREVQAIMSPFGVPLISDAIQGIFFSSDAAALLTRLKALNVGTVLASHPCVADLQQSHEWAKIVALLMIAMAVLGSAVALILRPRPVVKLYVRCEELFEDCVKAVRRALSSVDKKA